MYVLRLSMISCAACASPAEPAMHTPSKHRVRDASRGVPQRREGGEEGAKNVPNAAMKYFAYSNDTNSTKAVFRMSWLPSYVRTDHIVAHRNANAHRMSQENKQNENRSKFRTSSTHRRRETTTGVRNES